MCEIRGLAWVVPASDGVPVARMRDTLEHRGGEDAGLWWSEDRRVGLATRRVEPVQWVGFDYEELTREPSV